MSPKTVAILDHGPRREPAQSSMECRMSRSLELWLRTWPSRELCPMWRPRQSAGAQVQHHRCRWLHEWRPPHTMWGCPCRRCWLHGCWPPTPSIARVDNCVLQNSTRCPPCLLKRPKPAWWCRPGAARPNCKVPPRKACPGSTGSSPPPCPQGSFASASPPLERIRERTILLLLTSPCLWSPFDTKPPRLRSQRPRQCHKKKAYGEQQNR